MIRYRSEYEQTIERNRIVAECIFYCIVLIVVVTLTGLFFFSLPTAIDQELQKSSGSLSQSQKSAVVASWQVPQ